MLKVEFDIICITEARLTIAGETIIMFPSYTSYQSVRERRRWGDVSVFISNKFETNQLRDLSFNYDCLASVYVNVKIGRKDIVLATYYTHPITPFMEFVLTFLVARWTHLIEALIIL